MANKNRVFNPKHRRVSRTEITTAETAAGSIILLTLLLIVAWVFFQKNAYNPADQELSPEALAQGSREIPLYHPPLKRALTQQSSSGPATFELGVFPKSILEKSWTVSSTLKSFNHENLFEIINGEAEKFLQQGFTGMQTISLENPAKTEQIDIELYDQGDLRGSMGVFSEYISKESNIEKSGDAAYLMTTAGAIGRKGRYFFRIVGTAESDSVREKSAQLVAAFKALPEEKSEISVGYRILNKALGVDSRHITFQRKNVFQFDFTEDFWFARPDPAGTMRLFFHESSSPEQSLILLEELIAEQSYDFEIKEQQKDHILMWHPYLKNWFSLQRSGLYLFGVENGPDKDSVMAALKEMKRGLNDEE